ncbi:putative H-2 class II histocompatibility antigen [Triplophysa rosa]|uniref:H-2 class II histocompatibility antigen n=1 Tax=Triplophysa rosa TaxID=992332 RepID=A0A9W7WG30_TRIRA|nr:putative H-2 class II histocompatibility antigen [Triplophysa rosa]
MEGLSIITLIIACVLNIEAQSYHEYGQIEACGDRRDQDDFLIIYNNELAAYVDYREKKDVLTIPDFIGPVQHYLMYWEAVKALSACREAGEKFKEVYPNLPEHLEPPWTSIFVKDDAELNIKNTLICHVTGFFPPPVTISWTKNNLNVTDSATLSRYNPNKDGSMNVFSRLSFTPLEGDVYSCTVEHKALQQPQTRIWEIEINESSNGPLVFCGVGLGFGLLGLAAGGFFIVKGSKSPEF